MCVFQKNVCTYFKATQSKSMPLLVDLSTHSMIYQITSINNSVWKLPSTFVADSCSSFVNSTKNLPLLQKSPTHEYISFIRYLLLHASLHFSFPTNITLNIILNPVHFSPHKINIIKESNLTNKAVADPGFPRRVGGCQPLDSGQNLLFGKIFAENCMEIKEIGPGEGCTSLATPPLDLPM